eukprot:TRINITY_DN11301_c0_g1_i1.p1 TRINITY_DN11301_c0_g1~~TRINITY_DN11301_c0_g1_i1.p1  ORF type:complete len:130 (-),score=35.40 TRINITY_DN11301_c0_g1_i1:27-416(-)
MGRYKPKNASKAKATKRRKKDVDEIYFDLQPIGVAKIKNRPPDIDLPGMGNFYCVPCARYFVTEAIMQEHQKSKPHKKRVKIFKKEVPYGVNKEEVYGMKIDNKGGSTGTKTTGSETKANQNILDELNI